MVNKQVVDNNRSKTVSEVKMHGEFISDQVEWAMYVQEHNDSAVKYARSCQIVWCKNTHGKNIYTARA